MDIGGWLRSLGLEQYEAAFRQNAVDAEVLHDPTDQDLERLGVLLGHRRKLLRVIAALVCVPAQVIEPPPTPLPAAAGQTSSATSPHPSRRYAILPAVLLRSRSAGFGRPGGSALTGTRYGARESFAP